MDSSDVKNYSKCFNPKLESVDEFLERFKLQNKAALRVAGDEISQAAELLANSLPTNIITDLQRRLKPISLNSATYEELETQLKAAYSKNKTFIGAAVAFINRKQRRDENIESYAKAINELASQCNYKDCCRDKMLRDIFVSGIKCNRLLTTFITDRDIEKKTFADCIVTAKLFEQALRDVEDIHPEEKMAITSNVTEINKVHVSTPNKKSEATKKVPANYICIRCGTKAKHFVNDCFARNMNCNSCSKTGHLARVCKSKPNSDSLHRVEHDEVDDENYDDPTQFMMINSTRPAHEGSGNISNNSFL